MSWREVKKAIVLTWAYYGKEISDEVLLMHFEDLRALLGDPDLCLKALREWRLRGSNRPPLPKDIITLVDPRVSSEDHGAIAASRVVKAIKSFGYTNGKAARESLGEELWEVVNSFGGWYHLCSNLGTKIPLSIFHAQCRDLFAAKINSSGPDRLIEGKTPDKVTKLIQSTIKELK